MAFVLARASVRLSVCLPARTCFFPQQSIDGNRGLEYGCTFAPTRLHVRAHTDCHGQHCESNYALFSLSNYETFLNGPAVPVLAIIHTNRQSLHTWMDKLSCMAMSTDRHQSDTAHDGQDRAGMVVLTGAQIWLQQRLLLL